MKSGRPQRADYEYGRNGAANLFMLFVPLEGLRRIEVTDRRTTIDYAQNSHRLIGHSLPARQEDRVGSRQSQHARQGLALRSLPPPKPDRLWGASNGTMCPKMEAG